MGNKCVKDPYVRVLLDRREEIRNTITKLEAEYRALGELIMRDYRHTHPFKYEYDERGER